MFWKEFILLANRISKAKKLPQSVIPIAAIPFRRKSFFADNIRLVKDGVDISTDAYWGECLNAGGTQAFTRAPRTAAGITEEGKLILLVCDGRGSGGSKGYTLAELASKMISLGCKDAMNFDGGGSSCIVGKDGAILNNPSDGSERVVTSAIVITEIPH